MSESTEAGGAGSVVRPRWWHLDPGGAVLGLLLAALSVTPSLVPRPPLLQGAVAAVAFGLGYLLGTAVWLAVRRIVTVRPALRVQRMLWTAYGLVWLIAVGVLSVLAVVAQNEVRRRVEMPPLEAASPLLFLAGFLPIALLLLAIGRGTRRLFQALRDRVGRPVAALGTATVLIAGIGGLGTVVVGAVDSVYRDRNATSAVTVDPPRSPLVSGGPGSLVEWEDLGRHGAHFVAGGPDAAGIAAVIGQPAAEPIRVYAGLDSAVTTAERAALVVAELERTGAFEREVLVIATTTGSGWLEPQTVDAVEYLHAGRTAIAALQYAYTPSWVSFVFDPDAPVAAATELFEAVHARWSRLPEGERPLLISYGLSLGAHGSQAVFADLADVRARTDGALFVGSPAGSALWRALTAARDAGSPVWQPVLDGGREVRWISSPGDDAGLTAVWEEPRVLYLQHATDPVTWLDPALIWRAPEWLQPGQRADDVSPAMVWIPGVTAVQVVVDMLMGEAVPARHGHNYGDVIVHGWQEVAGDAGLDAAAVQRVQELIESYAEIRPATEG